MSKFKFTNLAALTLSISPSAYAAENFMDNEWVGIYLLGCGVAAFLTVAVELILLVIKWLANAYTFRKNLLKVELGEPPSRWLRLAIWLASGLFQAALSWLGALLAIYGFIVTLAKILRELFTSVPEEVKVLRFPLLNNPNLPTESVWARLSALNYRMGVGDDAWTMADQLHGLREDKTQFSPARAIVELERLDVIDATLIAAVKRRYEEAEA